MAMDFKVRLTFAALIFLIEVVLIAIFLDKYIGVAFVAALILALGSLYFTQPGVQKKRK